MPDIDTPLLLVKFLRLRPEGGQCRDAVVLQAPPPWGVSDILALAREVRRRYPSYVELDSWEVFCPPMRKAPEVHTTTREPWKFAGTLDDVEAAGRRGTPPGMAPNGGLTSTESARLQQADVDAYMAKFNRISAILDSPQLPAPNPAYSAGEILEVCGVERPSGLTGDALAYVRQRYDERVARLIEAAEAKQHWKIDRRQATVILAALGEPEPPRETQPEVPF